MQVTLEQVQARKGQLIQRKEQLNADLNATIGAIQDCEYWQGVLEKQEDQEKERSE